MSSNVSTTPGTVSFWLRLCRSGLSVVKKAFSRSPSFTTDHSEKSETRNLGSVV
jgi:hypothetical protein